MTKNSTQAGQIRRNIRRIREFRNVSREQIAEQMDIHARSYAKIENGETKLDIEVLEQIAQILEVSLGALLHLDDKTVFNNFNNNQDGQWIVSNHTVNLAEKELYEQYIAELKAHIADLKVQNEILREINVLNKK